MICFIKGADRSRVTLFPDCLDDWIDEDNPVRVVDAFIEGLDLHGLGFDRAEPAETGRPGYHPESLIENVLIDFIGL